MTLYFNPKVDFIFKKLMEEEELLVDFINRVLSRSGHHIVSAKIKNPTTPTERIEDKESILDVKAVADDGSYINIEIQRKDEKNMIKRTLFHWSKLYGEQLKKGKNYTLLEKTICINILDFNLLEEAHFHNHYQLINPYTQIKLDAPMEIHFLELKKYEKYRDLGLDKGLNDWMEFLNAPESTKQKPNPKIKKAIDTLEKLSYQDEVRELYELRMAAELNGEINRNTARSEGVKEGIKQIAIEMIREGESDEKVMKYTKLTLEQVRKLREIHG